MANEKNQQQGRTAGQIINSLNNGAPSEATKVDPFAGVAFKLATDAKVWKAKNGKLGRTMVHILIPGQTLGVPTVTRGTMEARFTSAADLECSVYVGGILGSRFNATDGVEATEESKKEYAAALATLKSNALAFVKAESAKGHKLSMKLGESVNTAGAVSAEDLGLTF